MCLPPVAPRLHSDSMAECVVCYLYRSSIGIPVADAARDVRSAVERRSGCLPGLLPRPFGESLAVFGSVARQTRQHDSDIDLLLMVLELPDGRMPRIGEGRILKIVGSGHGDARPDPVSCADGRSLVRPYSGNASYRET